MHRLCLAPFLLVAFASCKSSTAPISDLDALLISTRVEPDIIVAGTAANVVLTMTNPLDRPVSISSCPIFFWVEAANGQIIGGSKGVPCLAGVSVYGPLAFQPFETKTTTHQWRATETQNVPAGVYDVVGWVNDPARASARACLTVLPASGTRRGLQPTCATRLLAPPTNSTQYSPE